ncbi:hypothetical protein ERX46_13125 [Brumimicrobium glaciale]|uniref:Uncharacterized protein n=1 Tax=Brumimicrobium glaciale TaxID=200475 RepID=A0A4Q4KJW4_9FLAO|nr:hypothetical protein [Brumimicrobium glaciale]RYM32987.1 hypothetical protein ERX46_13125 [Brumimicrobium glaciale]
MVDDLLLVIKGSALNCGGRFANRPYWDMAFAGGKRRKKKKAILKENGFLKYENLEIRNPITIGSQLNIS